MDVKVLEERLRDWNVPFAVIADLETGHTMRIGSSTAFEFVNLENSLFRDAETVFATGRYLEGQILPRTWTQGNVSCFVYKPNEQIVIGLFCSDQRNPVEKYNWSRQLNARLVEAFALA